MCEMYQKYGHTGDRCWRNKESKNEVGEATKGDGKFMLIPVEPSTTIQMEGTVREANERYQRPNPVKHVQEMGRNRRHQVRGWTQLLKMKSKL